MRIGLKVNIDDAALKQSIQLARNWQGLIFIVLMKEVTSGTFIKNVL